jgi:hypothetical protein
LKKETATVISKKFGVKKQFEITGIEFLNVETGYAAIVNYRLPDGMVGNYAMFSGIKFNVEAQSVVTDVKSGRQIQESASARVADDGKVKITCSRTGTCECKVEGTVDTNTGIVKWGCCCEQCSAEVVHGIE